MNDWLEEGNGMDGWMQHTLLSNQPNVLLFSLTLFFCFLSYQPKSTLLSKEGEQILNFGNYLPFLDLSVRKWSIFRFNSFSFGYIIDLQLILICRSAMIKIVVVKNGSVICDDSGILVLSLFLMFFISVSIALICIGVPWEVPPCSLSIYNWKAILKNITASFTKL